MSFECKLVEDELLVDPEVFEVDDPDVSKDDSELICSYSQRTHSNRDQVSEL
jgi:hypothetical protein